MKKQTYKRMLSCILVLVMLLSIVPALNISAAEAEIENPASQITDSSSITEDGFEYSVYDGEIEIIGYSGSATCIEIPSKIDEYPVTSIGDGAFYGCSGLISVMIPISITDIGDFSFSHCSALERITVDERNTVFDSRDNCNAIIESQTNRLLYGCKTTVIPNTVVYVGQASFNGCTALTSIDIPSNVKHISFAAFSGCISLERVSIGNGVVSIGNESFSGCTSLKHIVIPSSITGIGVSAFLGCTALENITVDEGNTVYDSRDNCNGIILTKTNTLHLSCKTTNIPNNVVSLGRNSFYCRYDLSNITIPLSVVNIDSSAFYDCTSLEDVYYGGTEDQWNAIVIGSGNDNLINATIHFAGDMPEMPTEVPTENPTTKPTEKPTQATDPTEKPTENPTQATDPTEKPTQATNPTEKPTTEPTEKPTQATDPTEPATTLPAETVPTTTVPGSTDSAEITFPEEYISDENTDIAVAGDTADAELVVSEITSDKQMENIDLILVGERVSKVFDITLQKDGVEVQPDGKVFVRIPAENPDSKVYRMETDGTLTDMNAVFLDGYLIFTTEHFSLYVVAEPKENLGTEVTYLIGDANGDGKINVKDATQIQKAAASLVTLDDVQTLAADANGDEKVNVKDATAIQKFVAGIPVSFPIGEERTK